MPFLVFLVLWVTPIYALKSKLCRQVEQAAGSGPSLPLARPDFQNEWPKSLRKIVIDVAEEHDRGGFGDLSAGYLTAIDLKSRLPADVEVTLLVNDRVLGKLSTLLGRPLNPGESLSGVRIVHEDQFDPVSPIDLYVGLAGGGQGRRFLEKARSGKLPMVIDQSTLSDAEAFLAPRDWVPVQVGDLSLKMARAGANAAEAGVYSDPVALKLRHSTREQAKAFALAALRNSHAPSLVTDLVAGNVLKGANISMAYRVEYSGAISLAFRSYLLGLRENLEAGQSYAMVCPSGFNLSELNQGSLADRIVVIPPGRKAPENAEPGKIYLLNSGSLSHEAFVGLLAASDIPPIIQGDGALSAAIILGKPFVATRQPHNQLAVAGFGEKLQAQTKDPRQQKLIQEVYGRGNLRRTQELMQVEGLFRNASEHTPVLTDSILATAKALEPLRSEGKSIAELLLTKIISDPTARAELFAKLIELSVGPPPTDLRPYLNLPDPATRSTFLEQLIQSEYKSKPVLSEPLARRLAEAVEKEPDSKIQLLLLTALEEGQLSRFPEIAPLAVDVASRIAQITLSEDLKYSALKLIAYSSAETPLGRKVVLDTLLSKNESDKSVAILFFETHPFQTDQEKNAALGLARSNNKYTLKNLAQAWMSHPGTTTAEQDRIREAMLNHVANPEVSWDVRDAILAQGAWPAAFERKVMQGFVDGKRDFGTLLYAKDTLSTESGEVLLRLVADPGSKDRQTAVGLLMKTQVSRERKLVVLEQMMAEADPRNASDGLRGLLALGDLTPEIRARIRDRFSSGTFLPWVYKALRELPP